MEMHSAYVEVVGKWFPRSGLEPAAAGCLEFYLNDPHQTPPEELLTDICVPIAE
jgi:AraC family transcriptional regulator